MPEETEQASEQQESRAEEAVDQTATEGQDGAEQQDDAQEAETSSEEKPFDRKQAEAKIRKANSEAANLRKRLKELEPLAKKAKEFEDAKKSETERLTEQLQAANDRIAATRKRLVKSQVHALAGGSFADPEDAVGALDLDSYIDEDSGDIDEAAIKADLDALLERKPHWAKTQPQEGPRRPAPDRTQASGANKKQAPSPRDEFAGWLSSKL
ncbi:putative phage infection (PIP) family protein YhgE [Streptomyces sp. SAI-208]|uniref:hypothetical protein n=1 Tax=Streptomyces sp. SAI-208 TaxID=2940550 RepID=UPI0024758437|nr:hypothetical protein [Streptomyces sp. SAI-208]MDH6610326.1 putative phage infection (PIP) family protein YhgE [Streptomyces sp. SAI-208]